MICGGITKFAKAHSDKDFRLMVKEALDYTNFDFPVGGYYNGYYAMMVVRHMHEFGSG
jgi:hypothetical protein